VGSPFTALVAAVETLIATVLLGVSPTVAPAVVALVTFAVYSVDHVADADTDAASTPNRALVARRYGDQLMIAAALAYGLAVAVAVTGGPLALALTLLPGAFWVVYASDWLPDLGRAVGAALASITPDDRIAGRVGATVTDGGRSYVPRLKDVLVVNSVVVAAGWATALTFLPIAFAGSSAGPTVPVVFAYFLLRSFVDAELPERPGRRGGRGGRRRDASRRVRRRPDPVGAVRGGPARGRHRDGRGGRRPACVAWRSSGGARRRHRRVGLHHRARGSDRRRVGSRHRPGLQLPRRRRRDSGVTLVG